MEAALPQAVQKERGSVEVDSRKRARHTRAQDKLICCLQQGDEERTKLS